MKAKVVKKFRDKNTKEIYEVGQEIKVTKKRFEEMNSTSFGVLVEEIKEDTERDTKEETEQDTKKEDKPKQTKKSTKK